MPRGPQGIVLKIFRFIKSTVFLVLVCATLAISTIALTLKVVQLGVQVATLTASAEAANAAYIASAAAASAAYKVDKAQAVTKTKARERAKARIKRFAIAGAAIVPVVGMGAAPAMVAAFEKAEFDDWQEENPNQGFGDYACETGDITAEIIDETLQELPESLRPSSDKVSSLMPECGVDFDDFENQSWIFDDSKWLPSLDGIKNWVPSFKSDTQ